MDREKWAEQKVDEYLDGMRRFAEDPVNRECLECDIEDPCNDTCELYVEMWGDHQF